MVVSVCSQSVDFFLFAELLALAFYYVRGDGLFYRSGPRLELAEDAQTDSTWKGYKLYPLFGFVQLPEGDWKNSDKFRLNDYGFWSEFGNYPYARQHDNQYIIGIFGGSVAKGFHQVARDHLAKLLQQHPFFEDKEIVVLSFAHTAYKQPQQLMILNYFLALGQHLDMVVNIDGFNEVSLGLRNRYMGYSYSMPNASYVEGLKNVLDQGSMTPERQSHMALINRRKQQLKDIGAAAGNINLASLGIVSEQLYRHRLNQYRRAVAAYENTAPSTGESLIYLNREKRRRFDKKALLETIAESWAESSILMRDTLAIRDIPYVHILQPNQYFTQRVFSEEEAQIALSAAEKSSWREVEKGYPLLLGKADLLAGQGVALFDGTPIFDGESRPVYDDSCCHYNKLGNDILAEYIAGAIVETMESPAE